MAWILRSERLNRLKHAASISLSVDDRGEYRLVRYRCSYDSMQSFTLACTSDEKQRLPTITMQSKLEDWCSVQPLVHEGVLAVIQSGGNVKSNTIQSHDQDKSERMAATIMEGLKQCCRNVDNQFDQESFFQICAKVQHYCSDQGSSARKCGQLLACKAELRSFVWVSCDMAHQVRIASKDPLRANDNFNEQWLRLFGGKHALVPDIQHSDVWRARLVAAQRVVLEHRSAVNAVPAVQAAQDAVADPDGSPAMLQVEKVMRTFSFAKQRFNSTATPMMKYCCMLRAITLVCALQAADVFWQTFQTKTNYFFNILSSVLIRFVRRLLVATERYLIDLLS